MSVTYPMESESGKTDSWKAPDRESVTISTYDSPYGKMHIASTMRGICRLTLPHSGREEHVEDEFYGWLHSSFPQAVLVENYDSYKEVFKQLDAFFAGDLKQFTLKTDFVGTDFQRAVWKEIYGIPFGRVVSYGYIAKKVGRPGSSRAVGAATGANPIPIIVPCHRVVGSNGTLTGFGGGLSMKRSLLELEGFSVVRESGTDGGEDVTTDSAAAEEGIENPGAPDPGWLVRRRE